MKKEEKIKDEKKTKIITTADILRNKGLISDKKKKAYKFYVPSLSGEISFKIPSREEYLESMAIEGADADLYLVQLAVTSPNLSDKKLLEEFDCINSPLDVVEKIFLPGEIPEIAAEILTKGGFGVGNNPIDDLKK